MLSHVGSFIPLVILEGLSLVVMVLHKGRYVHELFQPHFVDVSD